MLGAKQGDRSVLHIAFLVVFFFASTLGMRRQTCSCHFLS